MAKGIVKTHDSYWFLDQKSKSKTKTQTLKFLSEPGIKPATCGTTF